MSEGKILPFTGVTQGFVAVDKVCDAAKAICSDVLILGTPNDNSGELYMAASNGDKQQALWWVEEFKMRLLRGDFDE
jgi:hypothetical protein